MASDREFLFSPLTGALLKFDQATGASTCPLSGHARSFEELQAYTIKTRSDMEDLERRYGFQSLLKRRQHKAMDEIQNNRTRATSDEDCPQCGNHGMEFYTAQLRSADEGQTIFYECPNCGYKYQLNS